MEKSCQLLILAVIYLSRGINLTSIPFILLILSSILRILSLTYIKLVSFSEYIILANFTICMYFSDSSLNYFMIGQLFNAKNIKNSFFIIIGLHSSFIFNFSIRDTILIEIIVFIHFINYFVQKRIKQQIILTNKDEKNKKENISLNIQQEDLNKSELRLKLIEYSSINSQSSIQRDMLKNILTIFPNGIIMIGKKNNIISANKYVKQLFKEIENEKIIEILQQGKNIILDDEQSFQFYSDCYQFKSYSSKHDFIKMSRLETLGQEINNSFLQPSGLVYSSGKSSIISATQMITKISDNQNVYTKSLTHKSTVYTKPPYLYFELILDILLVKVDDDNSELILFINDISSYNKLHILQQLNHNKSKLLRSVCHEIRNPLNCITQSISVLQDKVNQEISDLCLDPIQLSTGMLLNLVNDLLDVSQINSGKFRLSITQFNLNNLLSEITKLTHFSFQTKQLNLLISNSLNLITSDEKRIRQILINLVQNSLKFTQKGYIKIQVKRENEEIIKFEVIDTGCGIQKQDVIKLFKTFSQIQDNQYLNKEGIGLGLQISNILCQNLSINDPTSQKIGLNVESEGKGRGSKFFFYIYDHSFCDGQDHKLITESIYQFKDPQEQSESIQQTISFKNCDCKEILIVDDEPYNSKMLAMALQKYHLKIDTAQNGLEAFEKVITFPAFEDCGCKNYRIILMDLDMTIMDGLEASQRIRDELPNEKITIIGCSGFDSGQEEVCKASGMNGYFEKPVKITQILNLIDKMKKEESQNF